MNKITKEKVIKSYQKLQNGYESVLLLRNNGLTVKHLNRIRIKFKENGYIILVIKNTLAKIAAKKSKFSIMTDMITGPVIIAYGKDFVSVAKLIVNFQGENLPLDIIGGVIEGKILDKKSVIELSKLPSRKEIQSRLVGLMEAVPQKIAVLANEPGSRIARVIKVFSENNIRKEYKNG